MPDKPKQSREAPAPAPDKLTSDKAQRFFEGAASRTGEEGIFLQPTGAHTTDPFASKPSQPEASSPSPSSSQKPSEAPPAAESAPTPSNSGEGSPKSD